MARPGWMFEGLTKLLVVVAFAGCGGGRPTEQSSPTVRAVIGGREFQLEIASTGMEVDRGLSGRGSVADDGGMIFVFDEPQVLVFVMRDCGFALDLLYLDAEFRLVSVHEMAPETPRGPGEGSADPTEDAAYTARLRGYFSGEPAKFAIEVSGGTASSLGLRVGDRVGVDEAELLAGSRTK